MGGWNQRIVVLSSSVSTHEIKGPHFFLPFLFLSRQLDLIALIKCVISVTSQKVLCWFSLSFCEVRPNLLCKFMFRVQHRKTHLFFSCNLNAAHPVSFRLSVFLKRIMCQKICKCKLTTGVNDRPLRKNKSVVMHLL